jgi:hypothetical protein
VQAPAGRILYLRAMDSSMQITCWSWANSVLREVPCRGPQHAPPLLMHTTLAQYALARIRRILSGAPHAQKLGKPETRYNAKENESPFHRRAQRAA